MKNNALAGRCFESIAAQNQFLREWEATVADLRIHGTTKRQVLVWLPEVTDQKPVVRQSIRVLSRSLRQTMSDAERLTVGGIDSHGNDG